MSNPARPDGTKHPVAGPTPPLTGMPRPRVPVAPHPRPEPDLVTRLDGQRGWLNELDRSLKKRSIIALILTCLAVGVGASALYISLTKNSDADRIDALETRITAIEAAGAASGIAPMTTPGTPPPETGVTDPAPTVPPGGETEAPGDTGETPVPPPVTPGE
jgi:hypothetical protein